MLIIGRIPKSKTHLIFLLQHLHQWATDGTTLLLAGMDKHLSKGQFDLLEEHFGPSRFYPGVKKARIWEARLDKSLTLTTLPKTMIHLPEFNLSLSNLPNVFSQDKLDIGSRFFLENFSKLPEKKHVADLACGNGVLGLAYLRLHPEASMIFSDESFQAIESCETNWKLNLPKTDAIIRADDGLKQAKPSELELIICNPPFHQQHTVGTDIAFTLFKDAFRALKKNGELWVVANRHLTYHITLKKLFGNCSIEASNKKFVILKATKYR
jgi:16S rRNA (guanine1207-N2)-methyltransferase